MNWGCQNTYQKSFHGELDGVPVEGHSDALVDSQSDDGSQKQ